MQEHALNLEAVYSKIQKQKNLPILYILIDQFITKTHTTSESRVSFTCLIIQSFHSVYSLNVGNWTQQTTVTQHYATTCFQLNVSCNSNSSALEEGTELWAI